MIQKWNMTFMKAKSQLMKQYETQELQKYLFFGTELVEG